jgi:hypothetical protein
VYIVPFQSAEEGPATNGHYRISYISLDDETGNYDMFLMDTFTGEARNLSNSDSGIVYNSISEDGQSVAWIEDAFVHTWREAFNNGVSYQLPTDPDGADGAVQPQLSPDGVFVAWHENEDDTTPHYARVVVCENLPPGDNPVRLEVDYWDEVTTEEVPADEPYHPWLPVITDPVTYYRPDAEDKDDWSDTARLVMFPMFGPGFPSLGPEITHVGWFLVDTTAGQDPFVVRGTAPYSSLTDEFGQPTHALADQQHVSRLSVAPRPESDWYFEETGPWCGDPPMVTKRWNYIHSHKFVLTIETDEDGQNLAFVTHFTLESVYSIAYAGGNPLFTQVVQRGRFGENDGKLIGPAPVTHEQHHWWATSNRASNGIILSAVRAGDNRDVNTWIALQLPGDENVYRYNLGEYLDMGEGEHDIPCLSQGDFRLNGYDHPFPAVAFDCHHLSTGDIYLLRLVRCEPGYPILVTLKRLTQNGCSLWPRLSGWIPTTDD